MDIILIEEAKVKVKVNKTIHVPEFLKYPRITK